MIDTQYQIFELKDSMMGCMIFDHPESKEGYFHSSYSSKEEAEEAIQECGYYFTPYVILEVRIKRD